MYPSFTDYAQLLLLAIISQLVPFRYHRMREPAGGGFECGEDIILSWEESVCNGDMEKEVKGHV